MAFRFGGSNRGRGKDSLGGWVQQALQAVFGSDVSIMPSEVGVAKALLESLGYSVTKNGIVPTTTTTRPSTRPAPGGRQPPPPPTSTSPAPQPAEEPQTLFSTRNPKPGEPAGQDEASPYGPEIHLTPQSSNVYSFSYYRRSGDKAGTLYVRFRAHWLNQHSLTRGPGRLGGREQLHGELGSTVRGKGRPNEPGVMYAYYNVPPAVYARMIQASSKGKFVWDALRVRGTIYGHKYQYAAIQGQVTPSVGGVYIPRRATKSGFRTRSIANVGTGRRGFDSSTLPQQNGFSTRRR